MVPTQITSADGSLLGAVDGSNRLYTIGPKQTLVYTPAGTGSLLFLNGLLLDEQTDGYRAVAGEFTVTGPLQVTDLVSARLFETGAPSKFRISDSTIQGSNPTYRMISMSTPVHQVPLVPPLLFRNGLLLTNGYDYSLPSGAWIYLLPSNFIVDGDSLVAVTSIGGITCSTFTGSIAGGIDGSNVYFTLPFDFAGLMLFRNGALQTENYDYEIVNSRFIMMLPISIPQPGDVLTAQAYTASVPAQVTTFDGSLSFVEPTDDWIFRNGLLLTPPLDYSTIAPRAFSLAVPQSFTLTADGVPLMFRGGALQATGADYFLNGRQFTVSPVLGDFETLSAWMYPSPGPSRFDSPIGFYGLCNGENSQFLVPWDIEAKPLNVFRNGILLINATDYTKTGRWIQFAANQIPGLGETVSVVSGIGGVQLSSLASTITGTIDGLNPYFTLGLPVVAGVMLFRNGSLLIENSDFVRDGSLITFVFGQQPLTGDNLIAQAFASDPPISLVTPPLQPSSTLFQFSQPTPAPVMFRGGVLQTDGNDYLIRAPGLLVPFMAPLETLTALTFSSGVPSRFNTPAGLLGICDGVNATFQVPHWIIDAGIPFDLFRNGIYLTLVEDYTRAGQFVNLSANQIPAPGEVISLVAGFGGLRISTFNSGITGVIDGVNALFTLNAPTVSCMLFMNGALLAAGADYTLFGNDILLSADQIPQPGWGLAAISFADTSGPSQQTTVDGSIVAFPGNGGIMETGAPQVNGSPTTFALTYPQAPQPDDIMTVESFARDPTAPDMPPLNLGQRYSTLDGSISGALDGVNNLFTVNLPRSASTGLQISPTQILVWWNGDFMTPGVDYHLQNGNQIVLTTRFFPAAEDIVTAEVFSE